MAQAPPKSLREIRKWRQTHPSHKNRPRSSPRRALPRENPLRTEKGMPRPPGLGSPRCRRFPSLEFFGDESLSRLECQLDREASGQSRERTISLKSSSISFRMRKTMLIESRFHARCTDCIRAVSRHRGQGRRVASLLRTASLILPPEPIISCLHYSLGVSRVNHLDAKFESHPYPSNLDIYRRALSRLLKYFRFRFRIMRLSRRTAALQHHSP